MTISPPDALIGVQRPRVLRVPQKVTSTAGQEAAELAASAGLVLDDWQRFVLDVSLGERRDGQWAAFEVGLVVGRQNGKGSILEARELAGLFLFGERLILHSAHIFKTSWEAFLRVSSLIENTPDLDRKVKQIRRSHDDVSIELRSGARLRFLARNRGAGRGFSGDCVILDEAMYVGGDVMAALLPTLSARPNPQIWYTASAPFATSDQLHAVRRRAMADSDDPRLAYLEWSIDPEVDDDADPQSWAKANPSLGIRISEEFIRSEIKALPAAEFARERLGVPDVPVGETARVISEQDWAAGLDPASTIDGPLVLAVDMPPDRSWVSLVVGGRRGDGLAHVEVVDRRKGTSWLGAELVRLLGAHDIRHVLVAPGGPAGGVLVDVQEACREARPKDEGVLRLVGSGEFTQACGRFYDLVTSGALRHLGQDELDVAVAAAVRKATGDAWRWARSSADVDISPLCAASVAAWGVDALPVPAPRNQEAVLLWA